MVDQKAQALADAVKKANDGDKFINKETLTREVFDTKRFYFKRS